MAPSRPPHGNLAAHLTLSGSDPVPFRHKMRDLAGSQLDEFTRSIVVIALGQGCEPQSRRLGQGHLKLRPRVLHGDGIRHLVEGREQNIRVHRLLKVGIRVISLEAAKGGVIMLAFTIYIVNLLIDGCDNHNAD